MGIISRYPESADLIEKGIKLNFLECCALNTGFEENPVVLGQLKDSIGERKLKTHKDELKDTTELKAIPSESMRLTYFHIVSAEKQRLASGDKLNCGHSIQDHQSALDSIEKKLKIEIN